MSSVKSIPHQKIPRRGPSAGCAKMEQTPSQGAACAQQHHPSPAAPLAHSRPNAGREGSPAPGSAPPPAPQGCAALASAEAPENRRTQLALLTPSSSPPSLFQCVACTRPGPCQRPVSATPRRAGVRQWAALSLRKASVSANSTPLFRAPVDRGPATCAQRALPPSLSQHSHQFRHSKTHAVRSRVRSGPAQRSTRLRASCTLLRTHSCRARCIHAEERGMFLY